MRQRRETNIRDKVKWETMKNVDEKKIINHEIYSMPRKLRREKSSKK